MDLVIVLAVLAGLISLPLAALTHGADSREGFPRGTR